MKIGIVGERYNYISYSMLRESLACKDIEIIWFIDAKLTSTKRVKLYGKVFDYGLIIKLLKETFNFVNNLLNRNYYDCKKICDSKNIPYIVPENLSINNGLPDEMYQNPDADYALIAGCDQLLNENGLKIVKNKIINYHYSPLPAYRGKFVVFWQWYNCEPYIGYSFHEVNLGVDTGNVIYQGKVDYDYDEPFSKVSRRVISVSSEQVCKVYECLSNNQRVLLDKNLQSSFYPSKKYLELVIVDLSKSVYEVMNLFQRIGYFNLPNGIMIKRVIYSSKKIINKYQLDNEGIIIPLFDGHIKGVLFPKVPFWILKMLIGKKQMLQELS